MAICCLAGCGFPDRRGAADSIRQAIGTMPGVADAQARYDTSFDGGAHFTLTVTLGPTTTADQAAAVGRTFVDRMVAADFANFDVLLELKRPQGAAVSQFTVRFPDATHADPSAQAVADTAGWWLDVARSPAVGAATVSLPQGNTGVELRIDADDAVVAELMHVHPQLESARWTVSVPAPNPVDRPNTYEVTGTFPNHAARAAWQRVTAQLSRIDTASATTHLPPQQQPPTAVTVGLGFDPGREQDFERVARGVAPLLADLPLPALLQLHGRVQGPDRVVDRDLAVTVGGCTPADPKYTHPTEPLEAELRSKYEKC